MTKIFHSEELNEPFLSKLKSNLATAFDGCKTIAIKIHFGEPGNKTAFTPEQVKPITDILKSLNINFFLYDSSIMYGGPRSEPETHKKIAVEKGWDKLGEIRTNGDFIPVNGDSMTYEVCKELVEADGVLTISHFKGHVCSGFGAAIKNLGMGAVTKKSKTDIHAGGEPKIIGDCTLCKTCEKACPIHGITVTDKPEIKECYGCSNCIYVCPAKVFEPKINTFDVLLTEAANAAESQFKKKYYVSYLINITKECDCNEDSKQIIAPDSGYVMGDDIVAIDKAGYDLIIKKAGENVFKKVNFKDGIQHMNAAEKLGMGSKEYELVEKL